MFLTANFPDTNVSLTHSDNTIVETGSAMRDGKNWTYGAAANSAYVIGTRILITMKDKLGEIDVKEFVKRE